MLKLALEGAGFISAYDRSGIRRSLGVRRPSNLDEQAARELAVKQGVGVVLSGVDRAARQRLRGVGQGGPGGHRQRDRQRVDDRASSKDQVLGVATTLAADGSQGARRRHVRLRAAVRDGDPVGHFARRGARVRRGDGGDVQQQVRRRARRASRRRSRSIRSSASAYAAMAVDVAQPGQAAGRREVRQGSASVIVDSMTERERYPHARLLLLHHQRLSGVRQGVRRPDRAVRGRRGGAQQPRAVLDAAARHAGGGRRDAAGRRDPAEPRALPRRISRCTRTTAATSRPAEQEARAMQEPGLVCPAGPGVCAGGAGPAGGGDADLRRTREDRPARARPSRRPVWPTWPSTKAGSPTPSEFSRRAPPRIWRPRIPTGPPASSPRSPTSQLLRQQKAAAIAAAEKALRQQQAVKIRFLAARVFVEAGAADRAKRSPPASPPSSRPSRRPTRTIIEGLTALNGGDARQAIKLLTEANDAARHLDRPLRSRPRLSGGRRVPAGRLRVRPLHQAPRRGAGAVPRRGADVRLLPAGLLLPGPRPRRAEEREVRRILRRLPRHSRQVDGRPARAAKSASACAAQAAPSPAPPR